jgi:heme-degrading monooxygenase HmoA
VAVHVIIKRKFKMNQPDKIIPLLKELNARAESQPGCISKVTLQSNEEQGEYLVVSVWETVEDWNNWFMNPERKEIQNQVDSVIGERTFYEVFLPI